MTKLKHYREEDTRLYLSGLELKKIKKGGGKNANKKDSKTRI